MIDFAVMEKWPERCGQRGKYHFRGGMSREKKILRAPLVIIAPLSLNLIDITS